MSELMDRILADKLKARKELADLPFDEKLAIMEKMRERSALLAENSLRQQGDATDPDVRASGARVVGARPGAPKQAKP